MLFQGKRPAEKEITGDQEKAGNGGIAGQHPEIIGNTGRIQLYIMKEYHHHDGESFQKVQRQVTGFCHEILLLMILSDIVNDSTADVK